MRRGRDGEPIDEDVADHDCRRGWVGEGLNVQPCHICKPHLFEHQSESNQPSESPATSDSIAAARRHLRDVLGWPA